VIPLLAKVTPVRAATGQSLDADTAVIASRS
jgi:hypothetical protein